MQLRCVDSSVRHGRWWPGKLVSETYDFGLHVGKEYTCFGLSASLGEVAVILERDRVPDSGDAWCFAGLGEVPIDWRIRVPGAMLPDPSAPSSASYAPDVSLGYRDLVQNAVHINWASEYQVAELEVFRAEVDRRAAGELSTPANRVGLTCVRTGFTDRSWSDTGELVEPWVAYENIARHRPYECFGLEFRGGSVYVLVQGDDGFAELVNAWCFDGIGGVPKNWWLSVQGGASLQPAEGATNSPEIWVGYREFVTDAAHRRRLFDRDRDAVALFSREAEIRERDRLIRP